MHPDPTIPPRCRRSGSPDFDDAHGFWHDRESDDRPIPAIFWIIPGLIFGALFWLAIFWLAAPAIIAMADASVPTACRPAGAEIVACAEVIRR